MDVGRTDGMGVRGEAKRRRGVGEGVGEGVGAGGWAMLVGELPASLQRREVQTTWCLPRRERHARSSRLPGLSSMLCAGGSPGRRDGRCTYSLCITHAHPLCSPSLSLSLSLSLSASSASPPLPSASPVASRLLILLRAAWPRPVATARPTPPGPRRRAACTRASSIPPRLDAASIGAESRRRQHDGRRGRSDAVAAQAPCVGGGGGGCHGCRPGVNSDGSANSVEACS